MVALTELRTHIWNKKSLIVTMEKFYAGDQDSMTLGSSKSRPDKWMKMQMMTMRFVK
ncbi:unnamed protein product [Absidia cylindrospora]